jgi:dihydrofolate reductase
MEYNLIVATCNDNGIGKNNTLPWDKNSEDMRNFSKLTKGKGSKG